MSDTVRDITGQTLPTLLHQGACRPSRRSRFKEVFSVFKAVGGGDSAAPDSHFLRVFSDLSARFHFLNLQDS